MDAEALPRRVNKLSVHPQFELCTKEEHEEEYVQCIIALK
jgi:hypothetical protein